MNSSDQSYDMCSQLSISKCIMDSDKSLLLIKLEIASGYYCLLQSLSLKGLSHAILGNFRQLIE